MPVMDGFEAAQKIKELADTRKPQIPIIAVTAYRGDTGTD
jgi:CheY-like chemotaxis protein